MKTIILPRRLETTNADNSTKRYVPATSQRLAERRASRRWRSGAQRRSGTLPSRRIIYRQLEGTTGEKENLLEMFSPLSTTPICLARSNYVQHRPKLPKEGIYRRIVYCTLFLAWDGLDPDLNKKSNAEWVH